MASLPEDMDCVGKTDLEVFIACHLCARCLRCGAKTSDNPLAADSICSRCSQNNSLLQNQLYIECRRVADKYFEREIATGRAPKYYEPDPVVLRYLKCKLVSRMCKVYEIALAYDMQQMMKTINAGNPGSIQRISEIDFVTYPPWNSHHWVFVIHMSEDDFVFDPTGKQFGPDWALLQPWATYESEKILAITTVQFLPLGHRFTEVCPHLQLRDFGFAPSVLYDRFMYS